MDELVFIR